MSSRARLVRRAPLLQRITARLNFWDLLLRISEEINGNDWEDHLKAWSLPTGIILNVTFVIAQANSVKPVQDDVFSDYSARLGSGWTTWLASFLVYTLSVLSCANAAYTFQRSRHYRLFEQSVEEAPNTQSARRVLVDSSPISSSPLRFLANAIVATKAESRAHSDVNREVWEVAVWDPTPICLRLFYLFSPGHILVYWLLLPPASSDPRPSISILTTAVLNTLLSAQLSLLHHSFSQQSKDSVLIHKEVLHEYDTKFVNPSLNKVVRDVSTQTFGTQTNPSTLCEILTYPATTYVNRGFQTNPNPSYSALLSSSGLEHSPGPSRRIMRSLTTPTLLRSTDSVSPDLSSPLRPTPGLTARHERPSLAPLPLLNGSGGSFGIQNNPRSPIRNRHSNQKVTADVESSGFRGIRREGSPLKRVSTPSELQSGDRYRRQRGPA